MHCRFIVITPIALISILMGLCCWRKYRLYKRYDRSPPNRGRGTDSRTGSVLTNQDAPPDYEAVCMATTHINQSETEVVHLDQSQDLSQLTIPIIQPPCYEEAIKVSLDSSK